MYAIFVPGHGIIVPPKVGWMVNEAEYTLVFCYSITSVVLCCILEFSKGWGSRGHESLPLIILSTAAPQLGSWSEVD